ncbi:Zinc finger C2H2-type,Homeobox domain-like,HTH CenpB-type DNA-binding domain [Cinara cedri]|uniref:Zinc finger C2H2-type,Homeobox domain-like,HTH CenpB-type DNA-binding domain n=1 Tax=Cinara cedri TaxID=506608 RepID=A0A5E4N623_9HEMI|nr:Zinc finger C2H2-type,Homeobox domain-like,HTH CenpB-type DNA-binding domain [Cinara cedri]
MYTCDICKKNIIFKRNIVRHFKNVHNLTVGSITSSRDGNFKCPMCENQFAGRSSLRRHEKSKHKMIITAPLKNIKHSKCVTFEPSKLDDYPLFKTLIPEDYVYKINHIEMLENNYFRAKFEIADCTEDMFLIWLSKLEKKSKVTYRVKSFTRSTSTKIVFNKVYRCIHNTFPGKYHNPHPKHTGCPATLTIRIKKCSEALPIKNTMADNNMMLIPLKAIVTLYHYHNHEFVDIQKIKSTKKTPQNINKTECNGTSIQTKQQTNLNKEYFNKSNRINSMAYSSQLSVRNVEYNESTSEFIDANIILYQTDGNEVILNDQTQKTIIDNDNFELSEEFDNYIIVEHVNIENSLHNDDNNFIPTTSNIDARNDFTVSRVDFGYAGALRDPIRSNIKIAHENAEKARLYNFHVSGPLLQEKARKVANEISLENFKVSNGWLQKFRERRNISFKNICDYEPKNIFNCDETVLFFRALSDKTLCLKNETCSGGKIAKDRLTVLLCVNMVGEFETQLIIGKSLKPRCFKSVNVSALDAIFWIKSALKNIEPETVKNCFKKSGFFSSDTADCVMEHDNDANLHIFSELVPSIVEIEDYISIDNNILTEDNTLIILDIVNCNLDNFSEKETKQPEEEEEEYELIYNPTFEEVWKIINNLKTCFNNKDDEIALSMVANSQIHCEEQKKSAYARTRYSSGFRQFHKTAEEVVGTLQSVLKFVVVDAGRKGEPTYHDPSE